MAYIFYDDHDIDIKHWNVYGRDVENIECYEIASGKVGMYDRTIYHNYLSSLQVSSSDFLYIVKLMIAVLYAHSAPVMSVNWEWWKLGNYNFFQVELVFPFYYYFCVCVILLEPYDVNFDKKHNIRLRMIMSVEDLRSRVFDCLKIKPK